MAESALYASFIVRMWREPASDIATEQAPVWMGELESIQTGRTWQFLGLERLLPLLAGHLAGDPPAPSGAHEQE